MLSIAIVLVTYGATALVGGNGFLAVYLAGLITVSYTHLRAHETVLDLVCRLLLEKKQNNLCPASKTTPLPHSKSRHYAKRHSISHT